MTTTSERNKIKKLIVKCLTEDFNFGRGKRNLAIFDKETGSAIFNLTDLEMVVDKVVLGMNLYLKNLDIPKQQ